MFVSIKWKNAVVFTLMVAAILSIICSLQIAGILSDARNEFTDTVNSVFTNEYISEIDGFAAMSSKTVDTFSDNGTLVSKQTSDNPEAVFKKVEEKAYDLSIGKNRTLYLLDGSGNIMSSTSSPVSELPQGTFDFSGTEGEKSGFILKTEYMDFFLKTRLPSGAECILYINDNNEYFSAGLRRVAVLYLKCLPFVLILCFFMGLLWANSITIPLKKLNAWAKQLSEGKTEIKNEVVGNDEFGALSKTLCLMAQNLDDSAAQTNNEKIKLETILQNMTDGILAFNLDGKIIHINPEAQRLLGIQFLDDISFDSFFKEIQADISMGDLLYNKPEGNIERSITLDKKRFLKLSFATFSIKNKTGGIVVVIHDITKQQKLEKSRRGFVADVSHELRTPLTTIKSYAETLSDTPDAPPELMTKFLSVIASEADRMSRIISDLLTLSELDDKSPVYKIPEPIDIRSMTQSVVDRMTLDAKHKNQTLLYNPINDVPQIMGDRDGLERVIVNIISNAIKYTPEGGAINVYTSCVYNDACIKVTDNGIGIPKENLPHIFDRFYRVDKARSRGTGGTGLGLAIAKQTIESAFGGKIKITSDLGKGTEVSITIPVPERTQK